MRKIIISFAFAFVSTLIFVSCDKDTDVKVSGQFVGENERLILVEKLSPVGSMVVDSINTDEEGTFSFTIKNIDKDCPSFYNIRTSTSFLPLLVKAGESIKVSSVGNVYNNYVVEGSEGSEKIREFNTLLNKFTISMDSIMRIYDKTSDSSQLQMLGEEYGNLFIQRKRDAIRFISENANSLVSILPLYQPFSDGTFLFEDADDIFYFKIVSDSISKYYPSSPYAKSLRRDVERVMGVWSADSLINSSARQVVDFPEIEMKSSTGRIEKLSSYKGKVILLSFTASNPVEVKIINRELQELYNRKYKTNDNVVVFQVSLDTDKVQWLKSVNDQELKWISVCDFLGADSPSVGVWNVKKVPSSFLISPDGDIVGKNLSTLELESNIDQLLANLQ